MGEPYGKKTSLANTCVHSQKGRYHELQFVILEQAVKVRHTGASSSYWSRPPSYLRPYRLRGWSDGGHRNENLSACGYLIEACFDDTRKPRNWITIVTASVLLEPGTTSNEAELTGVELLVGALCKCVVESLQPMPWKTL